MKMSILTEGEGTGNRREMKRCVGQRGGGPRRGGDGGGKVRDLGLSGFFQQMLTERLLQALF